MRREGGEEGLGSGHRSMIGTRPRPTIQCDPAFTAEVLLGGVASTKVRCECGGRESFTFLG
jgi:hypothetical protein